MQDNGCWKGKRRKPTVWRRDIKNPRAHNFVLRVLAVFGVADGGGVLETEERMGGLFSRLWAAWGSDLANAWGTGARPSVPDSPHIR